MGSWTQDRCAAGLAHSSAVFNMLSLLGTWTPPEVPGDTVLRVQPWNHVDGDLFVVGTTSVAWTRGSCIQQRWHGLTDMVGVLDVNLAGTLYIVIGTKSCLHFFGVDGQALDVPLDPVLTRLFPCRAGVLLQVEDGQCFVLTEPLAPLVLLWGRSRHRQVMESRSDRIVTWEQDTGTHCLYKVSLSRDATECSLIWRGPKTDTCASSILMYGDSDTISLWLHWSAPASKLVSYRSTKGQTWESHVYERSVMSIMDYSGRPLILNADSTIGLYLDHDVWMHCALPDLPDVSLFAKATSVYKRRRSMSTDRSPVKKPHRGVSLPPDEAMLPEPDCTWKAARVTDFFSVGRHRLAVVLSTGQTLLAGAQDYQVSLIAQALLDRLKANLSTDIYHRIHRRFLTLLHMSLDTGDDMWNLAMTLLSFLLTPQVITPSLIQQVKSLQSNPKLYEDHSDTESLFRQSETLYFLHHTEGDLISSCSILLHSAIQACKHLTREAVANLSCLRNLIGLLAGRLCVKSTDLPHEFKDVEVIPWPDTVKLPEQNDQVDYAPLEKPTYLGTLKTLGHTIPKKLWASNMGFERFYQDPLIRAIFPNDLRVKDVESALLPQCPIDMQWEMPPQLGAAEVANEQQQHLRYLANRVLSTALGRGMFTFGSLSPTSAEVLSIPEPVVSARMPPVSALVTLDINAFVEEAGFWPDIHEGAAAGFAIRTDCNALTPGWIVLNMPKLTTAGSVDTKHCRQLYRHAGLLLALGIQGQLSGLGYAQWFSYLSLNDDLVTAALLVGLSASSMGSCNRAITKLLSIHLPSLHPSQSSDLLLATPVKMAALLGLGLVYAESLDRRMINVALSELCQVPRDDKNGVVDPWQEAHVLTAGFSLGLMTLQRGKHVPDIIRQLVAASSSKSKSLSRVTSTGSTVALCLAFLRTGRADAHALMGLPNNRHELDLIQPDLLCVKTLCRWLIQWDSIQASESWLRIQVPSFCQDMGQATWNIQAGACLALALRFMSSGRLDVLSIILKCYKELAAAASKVATHFAAKLDRAMARTCAEIALFSMCILMAGTGHVETLVLLRKQHMRLSADATYGSQAVVSFGAGLLFLGCGTRTLCAEKPIHLALLLMAFYPHFAATPGDSRSYFQVMRHFWAACTQPKAFPAALARLDSRFNVKCHIETPEAHMTVTDLKAPADLKAILTQCGEDCELAAMMLKSMPQYHAMRYSELRNHLLNVLN